MSGKRRKPETCTVDGCNGKYVANGYCRKHYQRWYMHGDHNVLKRENHGMEHTPEYNTWLAMKQRCNYRPNVAYHRYGGRGISVCKEWDSRFMNFYADMGPKPFRKAELDRIDNDGNYEPGNCRWVSHTDNMHNASNSKLSMDKAIEIRRLHRIGALTMLDIASRYDVHKETISAVLKNKTWKECNA